MYMNGYRCIACSRSLGGDFEGFQCPGCGGNLDIGYDYQNASREIDAGFPSGNHDMFDFSVLLPVERPTPPFPLRVGRTPLYAAPRLGQLAGLRNFYIKDDTLNPSASLKDRASAVVIARAIEAGAEVVAAASTGNAGSSLACLSAACGLKAVIFVPESAPPAKLAQMQAFGARVLAVRGSYDDAYDVCLAASREFGWLNRSTGYNPFTREGKKTCAFEIWQDLGEQVPDRVVVPSGDGNMLSAIWKGWKDLKAVGLIEQLPRIDCVQSETSASICITIDRLRADSATEPDWSAVQLVDVSAATVADSIAVDRPRDGLAAVRAVIESHGEAVRVPDREILDAIPELAATTGVFPEPAAAAPWAAMKRMIKTGSVSSDERVVCIVSGSGLKDITGVRTTLAEAPVIEPSLQAVRAQL